MRIRRNAIIIMKQHRAARKALFKQEGAKIFLLQRDISYYHSNKMENGFIRNCIPDTIHAQHIKK